MMPFKKGQSGNPGGRVGVPAEVREMAASAQQGSNRAADPLDEVR
jgi:hypothetical protein